MSCEVFRQRLNQCLDDRRSPETDLELTRHADQCPSCRQQLDTWMRVSSVMPLQRVSSDRSHSTVDRSARRRRRVAASAGLAAAVLVAIVWRPVAPTPGNVDVVVDPPVRVQPSDSRVALSNGQVDPTLWWQSVQQQDWVGQTMPAVRSVQEGVAPLGRSLRRAVTILTIGGRDQTS